MLGSLELRCERKKAALGSFEDKNVASSGLLQEAFDVLLGGGFQAQ